MYACTVIAFSYALQGKWAEAREAAERAFPRGTLVKGQLAGILRRMGEEKQSQDNRQDLVTGQSYDAPLGLGGTSDSWGTGQVRRVVRKGSGATPSGRSPSRVPRVTDHFEMACTGETLEPPGQPLP